MMMNILNLLSKFYYLNPRWLYLAITLVLLIPMIFTIPMPENKGSRGAQGVYDMVSACPTNKVILIDSSWDMGSKPECMAPLECFVNDLCVRKRKFVVFSSGLYAPTFANGVIIPIAEKAGYVYGRDWVNLGFIQPPAGSQTLLIDGFCRDIFATRPIDYNGTAITNIPLMQNVKNASDIHMVMAINYCPPQEWISIGKSVYGLEVAFASAAIMAPYYYVFMDSGQLCGLLTGNRGAYDYETLTGMFGMGRKVMMAFAFGLCFIIAAVLLGNLGFWAAKRTRRRV